MIGVPDFEGSPNTHGRNHGETQQIVGPEPTGSDFRIIIGPARLLGNAVARSTSMKPGRVKRKIGKIGSPFYSRSHELDQHASVR